jgi:regulatory protein
MVIAFFLNTTFTLFYTYMSLNLQAIQHYCAFQERCHSEVRYKLLELNFRGADLEEAMATLVEEGFLNEERYAQSYIGGKFRIKHWGRKKIIQELKKKKVSDYCIKKGLKEIDDETYLEVLKTLAFKKYTELINDKNIWIRKQKTQRYLLQKGFETDLIQDVLKEIEMNNL